MGDDEDKVEAGEDFLDEFGRIIVNVVDEDVFVGTLAPPVTLTNDFCKFSGIFESEADFETLSRSNLLYLLDVLMRPMSVALLGFKR